MSALRTTISLKSRSLGQGRDGVAAAHARVAALRLRYANRFDLYKENTGKVHPRDLRHGRHHGQHSGGTTTGGGTAPSTGTAPSNGSGTGSTDQPATGSGTTNGGGQGTVPLTDQGQDLLWTGSVGLGTPPQIFTFDFDTGSSDLFVNPNKYQPNNSSTSQNLGRNFTVSYGDGTTASGPIYQDTVSIAGLTATGQAIGSATQSTLSDQGNEGIAGMAFESISQFQSPPFFQTLINEGQVESPLFAFGIWTSNPRLDLGFIDDSAYTGSLSYSAVDESQGFWTTDFSVNDSQETGIVDTGTTLIIGPPDAVTSLFNALGVQTTTQQGEVYGLYDPSNPPRVTFTFGGQNFTLSNEALSFQTQGSQTVASIIGANIGAQGWIVGDSFLQDVYAVFDIGNKRIGFAPRAGLNASSQNEPMNMWKSVPSLED